MKPLLAFVVVLFTVPFSKLHGQDLEIFGGFAQFMMSDLKSIQKEINAQAPIPYTVVQAFPPYLQFGVSTTWQTRSGSRWGLGVNTTSTGARSYYEDYTGFASLDFVVKSWSLTFMYQRALVENSTNSFGWYGEAGANINNLEIESTVSITTNYQQGTERYKSWNRVLEFGIYDRLEISERVLLIGKVGFQVNHTGNLVSKTTSSEFDSGIDLSGFRILIGAGYRIGGW